jgi:hypothetical protein
MEKTKKNRFLRIAGLFFAWGTAAAFFNGLWAQNLVPNGSFENYDECPRNYTEFGQKLQVASWYSPNKSTPDYFNACSKFNVGVPNNFMGNTFAAQGNAYVGLLLAERPDLIAENQKPYNQREYIQVKLTNELAVGSQYRVQIKYCIAQRSAFAVNRLGVCLSPNRIKSKKVIRCHPQVFIDTLKTDSIAGVWNELTGTIHAKGGEKYLTIGNFFTDENLIYNPMDVSEYRGSVQKRIQEGGYAYYFIDQVSLRKVTE